MSRDEFIGKLNVLYVGDKNCLEELLTAYDEKGKEIERLNKKEEQLIRRLEDLIIVGEQVENEWAVDICNMVIQELKGSDKE